MATSARSQAPTVPLAGFEIDTLAKLYLSALDNLAHDSAMMYETAGEWRKLSHAEVHEQVEQIAAGLRDVGIATGERVAILSENRPEWAITDFASLLIGAVDVPVYATLPPDQVAYILRDSGARIVFVSTREQLDKVLEVRDDIPVEYIVAFDAASDASDVLTFAELRERGAKAIASGDFPGVRELGMQIEPDDVATLLYTSGTTGAPKGVMLTHHNIASNIAATAQHDVFEVRPGIIALSFLPLSHSFERMVDYYYWSGGATIAYVGSMDRIAASLLAVRPHIAAAAPRVFEKIYAAVMSAGGLRRKLILWAQRVGEAAVPDRLSGRRSGPTGFAEKLADRLVFSRLRERTGGRIQAFVSGSAPLSADIARFFWAAGLPIYEGYGLTETSPVLTVNRPGQAKLGSVGPPLPGTEIRIGPEGEILARGPQIMKGYHERPDATAEVIDGEGWFHTGDIGEIDDEGFLIITDRMKNLIVTAGGKNVAPQPIENAVLLSPYVTQVVMIGDRRPFTSLLVVPDYERLGKWASEQGIEASSDEALAGDPRVHDFLEKETLGRLTGFARYEQPKKIAIVAREFTIEAGEMTPTMKVKRPVVEERYASLVEALYGGR